MEEIAGRLRALHPHMLSRRKTCEGAECLTMLHEMLRYARPAGSKVEESFITRYIDTLPGVTRDGYGNRIVQVSNDNTILFACHTDTVHTRSQMQRVDKSRKHVFRLLDESACLGGDDTVGCWLLVNMILANVPGVYVFHRDEERGCHGSQYIVRHRDEYPWLASITSVISMDYPETYQLVTHQMGERCASDQYASRLARRFTPPLELNRDGIKTDSYIYRSIVPQCLNVSVGYENPHTPEETVSGAYCLWLLDQCKRVFTVDKAA